MTAVLLVSLYFIALTIFLGLDIIAKVPVTMYPLVVAGLGTLAASVVAGAFYVVAQSPGSGPFAVVATFIGAVAAGAGLAAMVRVGRPFARDGLRDGKAS